MNTKLLKQKILDLAIRGKLVPQDPNDEPASVLLQRIRAEREQLIVQGKIKRSKSTSDNQHYENVPFEIPESWAWTTIKDICSKIGSGSTPRGSNYAPSGIPFFRSQNVYDEGLVYDDIKYISPEVHKGMINTEVIANDVLLNITGGSLGRCAIVPSDFTIGNVSQHVCILRPIYVLSEYLHFFCLSSFFARTMVISGSGREGLPKYSLEKMQIPIPPLSEQKRIVAEVEKWYSVIDEIEANKSELQECIKQAKSKILSLAISGKLVPQNQNDEPAIELLKRLNPHFTPCDTSHYENLPENWCVATLGDVGKWQAGGTPKRGIKEYYGGDIPWLKTGDLNDDYIREIPESITQTGLDNSSAKLNPKDSVLIAMYGATIGKLGILTFPATTNQACCACVEYPALDMMYLFYFLLSHRDVFVSQGGGGAQPNISKEIIVNTQIPIPPLAEQKRIVVALEKVFSQIDSITAEL